MALEFLSEAEAAREQFLNQPGEKLASRGLALLRLTCNGPGIKAGELIFNTPTGYSDMSDRRGILTGDVVQLAAMDGLSPPSLF